MRAEAAELTWQSVKPPGEYAMTMKFSTVRQLGRTLAVAAAVSRGRSGVLDRCLLLRTMATGTGEVRRLDIAGVYPPIATPFDADENICYDRLKENLDRWNAVPFRGETC